MGTAAKSITSEGRREERPAVRTQADEEVEPNVVVINIQPDEGIVLQFGAKKPGGQMQMVPVQAKFSYRTAFGSNTPVADQNLLLDARRGDPTLFTRSDEIEAEWSIITPIEEAWAQLPAPDFPNCAAGSEGPRAAWVAERGHSFRF